MPPAARTSDPTTHAATPLAPGPGSPDVKIGYMPAWRALPAGMGAGIESASNAMNDFMTAASLDPVSTPLKLTEIFTALSQDTGSAAGKGAPGAPGGAATAQTTLISANVALTATYTTAAAVPGGEPAARTVYTEGIKAAAATAVSAAMSGMAGVADMHICPLPVPIPPHGPGMVTKGSKSVFINKLPACRQGDKVFEAAGGEDPIAMGCPTVLIGDDGGGPPQADPASVAAAVAEAVQNAQAQSTAASLVSGARAGTPLIEICPACARMREAAQHAKHMVAFRVVDDKTDQPIPGVALKITLPDGTEEHYTTDSNGKVEIDDLDKAGECRVTCDKKEYTLPKTVDFVGMGETRISPPDENERQEQ